MIGPTTLWNGTNDYSNYDGYDGNTRKNNNLYHDDNSTNDNDLSHP